MTNLTITLPNEIAKKLAIIPNKNRFIAKVLNEKFEQERRKEVERLMIEGYKATNIEDRDLNTEWEKASLERWD